MMKSSDREIPGGRESESESSIYSIYNLHALASLQKGLRQVYLARGRSVREADDLLTRLTVNLRLLDHLYHLAREALRGDRASAVAFHRALQSLLERNPDFRGSTQVLLDRVGIPWPTQGALVTSGQVSPLTQLRSQPRQTISLARRLPAGRSGLPCATVRYPGMATIYIALWDIYILRRNELIQPPTHELLPALDAVVALSLGHGHVEVLSGSLTDGGLESVDRVVERERMLGNPYFQQGSSHAETSFPLFPLPMPLGPVGPVGPLGSGGPGRFSEPGSGRFPIPGHTFLPALVDCEMLREACEGWLIDAVNAGLPDLPLPPIVTAWADNIEAIELVGRCAGNAIIIRGQGFGSPKPPTVELIMKVNGVCAVVPVNPANWSDTEISVTLPAGVMPGPVGFFDAAQAQVAGNSYNQQVHSYNEAVQLVATASRCLGQPLDLPTFSGYKNNSIPCPPETAVNVIEVGLPIIHSFTVATDATSGQEIVAAPDDELVLRWNVENADTIELRRLNVVSGWPGPGFGVSNSVTNPSGSSWNLGPANHSNFSEFVYRLTATNACGSEQADVRVVASQRPRIHIEAIEVTQSIQTMDHQVPLVRHKPTVVRVYATHELNGFGGVDTVTNVTGRMRVRSGSSWSHWFHPVNGVAPNPPDPPLPDPTASINLRENPNRTLTNDTLNFIIPEALCTGTMDIAVELQVDNFGAPPGRPGFSELTSATFEDFVTFQPRRRLKIRYIPVTVTPDPNGVIATPAPTDGLSNPPTNAQCRDFIQESLKFVPATAESITRHPFLAVEVSVNSITIRNLDGAVLISRSLDFDVSGNFWLELIRLIRTCSFLDFTNFICPEDDDSYWALLVPAIGPGMWGRANWIGGGEYLALMGRSGVFLSQGAEGHAAHELAHCLQQTHLHLCGATGGDDPSTDQWPDNGRIVDVPFDISRNSTVTGTEINDLMTYCPVRWTSPRRWQRLFDAVGGA